MLYKVGQALLQTRTVFLIYKVGQVVLQSVTAITKLGSYHEVGQYNILDVR